MSLTIQPSLNIIINTAVVGALDSGSGAAVIDIYNSSDTLLSTCPLQDPCGTVHSTTGQLTLAIGARDEEAAASGTAAYAAFCTSDGAERFRLTCVAGSSPVADNMVMPSLAIVAGAPVEITGVVIG
jgi:hypothetical protein